MSQVKPQNDMIDTWTNDPDSMARPRKISFSGRVVLDLGTYLYDGAGNIKSIGSRLFAYDWVSRLTEANLQPFSKAQSYTFDSFQEQTEEWHPHSNLPLSFLTTHELRSEFLPTDLTAQQLPLELPMVSMTAHERRLDVHPELLSTQELLLELQRVILSAQEVRLNVQTSFRLPTRQSLKAPDSISVI